METTPEQVHTHVHSSAGKRWLITIVIILLIAGAYKFGYTQGKSGYVFQPSTFKVINQKDQPGVADYNLLWDTIAKLKASHIEKPTDDQKILYGAVKGAVESVGDPYTTFFTPEELKSFETDLSGSFEGIGAEIGKQNGVIVVIAPIDGTPAKQAGLLPKDIILKVDGQDASSWSTEEAVRHIRGQKGTEVTLSIFRDGRSEAFDVKIKRDAIVIKSVKWEQKTVKDASGKERKVGYISVSRFGDDTSALFSSAVQDLRAKGMDTLVLDLRNNPGGYLETAVDLSSYWVPKDKVVVTEAHSDGKNIEYKSKGYTRLSGVKTITLINGGSASASEILAGALHDYTLTSLYGEKSFGKGSVQEVLDLQGGAGLKVTIAKWLTPSGHNINKEGIAPDTEVKLTEDDIKNQKDPQLDKALQDMVK